MKSSPLSENSGRETKFLCCGVALCNYDLFHAVCMCMDDSDEVINVYMGQVYMKVNSPLHAM